MQPPGANTVLVRHGDLNTKSPTVKGYMVGILCENLEAILTDRGLPGTVDYEDDWSRPVIQTTEAAVEDVAIAGSDTFGVVSTSPAREVSPDLEAITDALAETATACYADGTFAVDATRADKSVPYTSKDIAVDGGNAIWEAVEDAFEPAVDLEQPDLTFGVEVREGSAYVFLERFDGPGGLPLGSQAPVVALVSGGIDSPVAAYELMRRGSPVIPVYVSLGHYGGPDHEARAIETVSTLATYAPNFDMDIYRVPGGDTVSLLAETMEQGRMLSLHRFFYSVAAHLAEHHDASAIVTGEALGQKSSQTAQNLGVTSQITALPIHRPLLTWDKHRIVARAREIGTFSDSTINAGCNRIAPDRVETNARLARLLEVEPDDLRERAAKAAANADVVDVRA